MTFLEMIILFAFALLIISWEAYMRGWAKGYKEGAEFVRDIKFKTIGEVNGSDSKSNL